MEEKNINDEKIDNFIKENWFKLSFAVAVILIGFSFFYYFVIFTPHREQTKIDQQKQEQLAALAAKEKEKQEAKDAIDSCIEFANDNYISRWNNECDYLDKLTKSCKAILIETFSYSEYIEKEGLSKNIDDSNYFSIFDYLKKKEDCSCRLPSITADRLNNNLKEDKDECYKKFPQN